MYLPISRPCTIYTRSHEPHPPNPVPPSLHDHMHELAVRTMSQYLVLLVLSVAAATTSASKSTQVSY